MIPIIHARIHQKIKAHAQGNIVSYAFVKEWVARVIIKKGGIPREDIQPTIKDLENLGLLKKVCRLKYQVLPNKKRKVRDPII